MLEHTKKPRTEELIQITIIGPAANREKAIRGVKKIRIFRHIRLSPLA